VGRAYDAVFLGVGAQPAKKAGVAERVRRSADPDLERFERVLAVEDALVKVDKDTHATGRPGFFAGGDVVSKVRYVSEALGHGKRAAYGIASYLGHAEAARVARATLAEAVSPDQINTSYFLEAARLEKAKVSVNDGEGHTRETGGVFSVAEAGEEAARCFTCGARTECDNCVLFCPDMALVHNESRDEYYDVLAQYCKGCYVCAAECPRGIIDMTAQENR